VVNPKYFEYADRRLKHLVDSGLVPAIVGAWGRGDCNTWWEEAHKGLYQPVLLSVQQALVRKVKGSVVLQPGRAV
jgi:hypothetical protein